MQDRNNKITQNLVPESIRIVDFYDDGQDARHYTFKFTDRRKVPTKVKPGQFFILNVPGAGEAPFTYVTLPDGQGRFDALIRNVHGAVTTALFKINTGAILGHRGALGKSWPLHELERKNILIIAGGCGLAPLAALIDQLVSSSEHKSLSLIYSARSEAMQVLARQRDRWFKHFPIYETLDTFAENYRHGSPLNYIEQAIDTMGSQPDVILSCGPESLMLAVGDYFSERGLPANMIWLSLERRMRCGIGTCGHCYIANQYACIDGPTYRFDTLQDLLAKTPNRTNSNSALRHC